MSTATNPDELKDQFAEGDTPQKKPRRLSNLLVRFFTGIVVLPFFIILIFLGGWFVTIPIGFLMLVGILEFYVMEKKRGQQNNAFIGVIASLMVLLAFHYEEAILWQVAVIFTIVLTFALEFRHEQDMRDSLFRIITTIAGIFYIAFPMAFLVAIRDTPSGFHWFFAFIYTTWGTDTFAYLFGNMFGKTKLAPTLSPSKTVEGAVGGIISGALLPLPVLYQGGIPITISAIILFMITPFAATLGDLFESGVKRFFGVKDSHIPRLNIIPGHGGVLDRIDSTLWVATVMYIYLVLTGSISLLI